MRWADPGSNFRRSFILLCDIDGIGGRFVVRVSLNARFVQSSDSCLSSKGDLRRDSQAQAFLAVVLEIATAASGRSPQPRDLF